MANEFRVKNGIISSSIATDSGDFTIDSAADVVIDVDGADIILKDNGTAFGRFKRSSSDFIIKSEDDDNDIIFKGEDGGSTITALTLDMSEAGAATFNSTITAVGTSVFTNLDISGDVDIDGTLETDALTVGGTTALIAGAQTAITTDYNTSRKIGRDADNLIDFTTDNEITFRAATYDVGVLTANKMLLHSDGMPSANGAPAFEVFTWDNGDADGETTNATRISMKTKQDSTNTSGMILKSEITVNTDAYSGYGSEVLTTNGPIHFEGHDDTYGFWGPINAPVSGQMGALLIAKTNYHNEYSASGNVLPQSQLEVRSPAGGPGTLTLSTEELTVVDGDKLGKIDFIAPKESSGTDAILLAASIWAEADDTFAADNNTTDLVFATGSSAAAAEKFRITAAGHFVPSSDDASDLGTSSLQFRNGYFDGTLEADAITIGGTAIGSIYGAVAGSSSIVTTGALDSGSITSGFGTIDTGSSNITTTGVGSFGSLDISGNVDIDGTTNLDAVDIDGNVQLDGSLIVGVDDTGYDVTFFGATASAYMMWDASADDLILGGTAGLTMDGNTITGIDDSGEFTDDDAHIMTSAAVNDRITSFGYTTNTGTLVAGAQTGLTTDYNAGRKIGRDSDNQIDFSTDNEMRFRVNGANQIKIIDNAIVPFGGDDDIDIGASDNQFKDGFFDGTLEADAITLGGTALGSLYSPIAGSSSITTVGTIGTGTWQGTAIASAYLDSDTAHLSGSQTFSGDKTFSGSITIGGHAFDDIDIGSEFVDTDDHIMSSGAIKEKIESYGYTTNTGDITGVDLTVTSPITIASETNTTSGSYSATLGLDDPINLSELNESTDATSDKILLWDESASSWKYMTLDNLQDSIDTTGGGGGGMSDLVDDTSPQLGGDLDTNSRNIIIDDAHGIYDENSNEQMIFQTVANATAYFQIWNGISDSTTATLFGTDVVTHDTAGGGRMTGPGIEATGSATDVGFTMRTKGLGQFVMMNDDTTTAAAPVLTLLRYHSSEADDDVLGLIKFVGPDSSMDSPGLEDHRDYAKIECNLVDSNTSSADGNLMFSALIANSHKDLMRVGAHEDDDDAAGVALFRGQMIDHGSNHTLTEADEAGCYVRATAAITLTLPASPAKGEQYVIISDHAGTTTISANGSDTMNGSTSNQTITTRYEAKTFIAVSSSAWIVIG